MYSSHNYNRRVGILRGLMKELREKTGLTQIEFANKFKISVRTVQSWEREQRVPPPHVVFMIERILELEEDLKKYTDKS